MMQQELYLTEAGDAGAVEPTDANQCGLGDCFLIATLDETALVDSSLITNAIAQNADGTQTVMLYVQTGFSQNGRPTFAVDPQTVNDATFAANAVNSYGQSILNGIQEIWPQVIEEAFANVDGGYAVIGGGGYPSLAEMQLTGNPAQVVDPLSVTGEQLTAWNAARDLIVLGTPATGTLGYGLVNDHAYYYEGMTILDGAQAVLLGNPWGRDNPQPIPVSALASNFNQVDVDSTGAPNLVPPYKAPLYADLTIFVSEDAWQGDARFTVTVDGTQMGGVYSATTSHAGVMMVGNGLPTGSEAIDLGQFTNVKHQVAVTFLNDAYSGPSADRNLYVDGVSFDGQPQQQQQQTGALLGYGPGTQQTTAYGTSGQSLSGFPGLVLDLSQDAWQGNANYQIDVDGNPFGGIRTVMHTHPTDPALVGPWAGNDDQVVIGPLQAGQHMVSMKFINDAYGGSSSTDRNLYLDAATYDGATVQGASQALYTDSTFSFTVGTAPPYAEVDPVISAPKLDNQGVNAGGTLGHNLGTPQVWPYAGTTPGIRGHFDSYS